ncbi:MAG: orotidine-5'-phosphate decarboxylase [Pirellulaceae bacterium]
MKPSSFGDRLAAAVTSKRSAVCVGLDPRWESLPAAIRAGVDATCLKSIAGATNCYCREVIDAVAETAAIIKPQAAFFEQLGPAGMVALADVIAYASKSNLLVLLDGKRGDIGSTAEGYADAYLGSESAWGCDALTVNPYLGDDTLEPFFSTALSRSAGVFVLVKTSNPGSGFIQDQSVGTEKIYQRIAGLVHAAANREVGESGYGSIGAVVGATYPEQLADLRQAMPGVWILIPGYGMQGGPWLM